MAEREAASAVLPRAEAPVVKASSTAAISSCLFRFLTIMTSFAVLQGWGYPRFCVLQAVPVISVIVLEMFLFRISFMFILFPGFRMLFIVFFFPGLQFSLAFSLLFLLWLFPLVLILVGLIFLYFGSLFLVLFILGMLAIVVLELRRLALPGFHLGGLAVVSSGNGGGNKGATHEGESCQGCGEKDVHFFHDNLDSAGNTPALCVILL